MHALGVTAAEIDIKPSCLQMLKDLGHPFAQHACSLSVNDAQRAQVGANCGVQRLKERRFGFVNPKPAHVNFGLYLDFW